MSTKIVFTGSHGVGKTSLATSVFEALKHRCDTTLTPEMARLLVEMGHEVNDRINEDGVVAYLDLYLRHSRKATGQVILSDRSIFDLYVYTHELSGGRIKATYIDLVKELVFAEVQSVASYIYVPIEFQVQADEVRPGDTAYHRHIDEMVLAQFKYFGAKTMTVTGTLEQRRSQVLEHLNAIQAI